MGKREHVRKDGEEKASDESKIKLMENSWLC